MLIDVAVSVLLFLLVALVSGNNLVACSGSIISGRLVKKSTGIAIAVLGYIAGLYFQGGLLGRSIIALMPYRSPALVLLAFAVANIIFIIAHRFRVPQSLSISFASILVGVSLASGRNVDMRFIALMLAFWVIGSFLSMGVSFFATRASKKIPAKGIWAKLRVIRLAAIATAFLTAFTLGANTFGFLYASVPSSGYYFAVVVVAIILGSAFLSGGELRRMGNEIMPLRYIDTINTQVSSMIAVEIGTLLGIPISNTQTYTSSIYGAGIGYKSRLLLKRPLVAIVSTWLLVAFIGFAVAFASAYLLLH
ncbi:MAG: inorganic phosphate transporter [Candidatus Micrarchaeaceae archaeon]